ncbi:SRPBCC family protein [Algihabitans albus]|uniref:SRPBCC family protein n=1 Tax=Algihabitans albus TaxID=2164067 RepID=UPI0013C314BE|nr:SRPBCC domain-containing protein [Algihabitans albus]
MGFLRSPVGEEPVVLEGLFRAPLARVYRAWTDPEQIVQWFGPGREKGKGCLISATLDLRVGGHWHFVLSQDDGGRASLQGTYSVVETESCLSFSWCHVRETADGRREETPRSQVTVRFRAEGASTHVYLRHEGILREDGRKGVGGGWDASFQQLGDWLAAAVTGPA